MVKILTAIFLPPYGVYLQTGIGKRFYLNIGLSLLGLVPGIIHAIWGLRAEKKSFRLDTWYRKN